MQPNIISNLRHAIAYPLLILIAALPVEIMFVQSLMNNQMQAAGFLGLMVVPIWVLTPIAVWGFYTDRRKLLRGEFTERSSTASAAEPHPPSSG